MDTTRELFVEEVSDAYDAEHRFLTAMEEMQGKAEDAELKKGITDHIAQTQDHIEWLGEIFSRLERKPTRKTCDGAKGIVADGQKSVGEVGAATLRDSVIAAGLAKAEHYEIATYSALVAGAETMGNEPMAQVLKRILGQEQAVAERLGRAAPTLLKKAADEESAPR